MQIKFFLLNAIKTVDSTLNMCYNSTIRDTGVAGRVTWVLYVSQVDGYFTVDVSYNREGGVAMRLTGLEQETIINYNNAENVASVYTCNRHLIAAMDKYTEEYNECTVSRRGEGWSEYSVPKKWVKVKPPKKISAQQRAEMAERMRAVAAERVTRQKGNNLMEVYNKQYVK